MKMRKFAFSSLVALSLLVNIAIALIGGAWLHLRMRPIIVSPEQMRGVIKELSWNSAGEWRVVQQDQNNIIVEYKLPIYDITRYSLSKDTFRLSEELSSRAAPFRLSYEGCDILSKEGEAPGFECMKFRDLSPPERKLEQDWSPAYDNCAAEKALSGDAEAAKECADYYAKETNARHRWEIIAAENGNSTAQYNYAIELLATNIPAARSRALYWLGRSSEQGNKMAKELLQDLLNTPDMTSPPQPPSDKRK